MDGLSGPGRLTPEDPKYEVSKMGFFQSKVENTSAAKGIDGDQESKNRKESEEEALEDSVIVELDNDDLSQKSNDEKKKIDSAAYTIKFNKHTELVELVDINSGEVVQSVRPDELIALVSDLKHASGVFVDNEI